MAVCIAVGRSGDLTWLITKTARVRFSSPLYRTLYGWPPWGIGSTPSGVGLKTAGYPLAAPSLIKPGLALSEDMQKYTYDSRSLVARP